MSKDTSLQATSITRLLEDVLGCKWSWAVLRSVRQGVNRPGQMRREIVGISAKVLNERLHKLMAHGVLIKTEYPGKVLHVEYHFTSLGQRFNAVLEAVEVLESAAGEVKAS